MKRNRIISLLLAVVSVMLLALPALAAVDHFPIETKTKAIKTGQIYVKESEDRGRDITVKGPSVTLVFDVENNKDYVYQWEYLTEDGDWALIGGANGSVYAPIDNLKSGKTYTIRCVATLQSNGHQIVPSRLVNLIVE